MVDIDKTDGDKMEEAERNNTDKTTRFDRDKDKGDKMEKKQETRSTKPNRYYMDKDDRDKMENNDRDQIDETDGDNMYQANRNNEGYAIQDKRHKPNSTRKHDTQSRNAAAIYIRKNICPWYL